MSKTYLEYHGTTIVDPAKRRILDNAVFNGFKIKKHEQMNDGTFESNIIKPISKFVSGGLLYYFMTNFAGQISSFFEINTKKDNCMKGSYGVYYDIIST